MLDAPGGRLARSAVVFENLRQLPGSLSSLLSEVIRRVVRSRLRTALVDESGTVKAFVGLVGKFLPVVIYSSESELPTPRRVLVVEDQVENLDFLRVVIESAGHACKAVTSVRQAIEALDAEEFDVVLLDLVLPDAEGLEVARHILDRGLRIPIVAVSANLDRLEGASEIRRQVRKPYRARDILEAIRKS
jgi:CheY-like chemotaxis protein